MTTGPAHWRSLQSVMLATVHVAVIAYAIRTFLRPAGSPGAVFVWVPLTIALALLFSWPIARVLTRAFEPGQGPGDPTCTTCGRGVLRPLVRQSRSLFAEAAGHRCSLCGTTFRQVGDAIVEEPATPKDGPIEPDGIEFLGDEASEGEIRFLDEWPA